MSNATSTAPRQRVDDKHPHQINLTVDQDQHSGLVRSIRAQVPGISQEDAEDAVQDSWIVLAEKADRLDPGPIGGYLRGTARNKAMKIREKGRRTTSLDALAEVAGDATSALVDHRFGSLDSHVELAELSDDPIAIRAINAARKGAAACVAPRGMHHRNARYTDEQVQRVRELRARGVTYSRIEKLTGVPAGYGPMLVRRASRIIDSSEGWTRQLVIDAIRRFHKRFGRAPRYRDAEGNLTMPSPNTVRRLFGSWKEAVRAAGIEPAYDDRRTTPWTPTEMILAFCSWRLHHGRWPGRDDMVADPTLPSPATTRRHFGTQSPIRLVRAVLVRLA